MFANTIKNGIVREINDSRDEVEKRMRRMVNKSI
jgi:hypothetical protein